MGDRMTRLMVDAELGEQIDAADRRAQLCDVLAFYIGGANAAHVWTQAELIETLAKLPNIKYLLPIYVYGPQDLAGRDAAHDANNRASAFGCPVGVSIMLDVEQGDAEHAHDSGWLDEWLAGIFPRRPVAYTSASARGHIPAGFDLLLAAWNRTPHFEPGTVGTQWTSPVVDRTLGFDVSLVNDTLPLWQVRPASTGTGMSGPPSSPAPPPAPHDARPALNAPIVELVPTGDDGGYWLIAEDGGVFAFGNADALTPHGADGKPLAAEHLAAAIVGAKRTSDGRGLWLVGADGGVFTAGDAKFHGALPQHFSPAPNTAPDPTP